MSLSKTFSKIGYVFKKNAPKLLTVVGTTAIIGGTVVACNEARKMDPIIEELREKVAKIRENQAEGRKIEEVGAGITPDGLMAVASDYDNKEAAKDLIKVYAVAGTKFAKLFAPGVLLLSTGLYCHHKGFAIQNNRYVAATAAACAAKATTDNLVEAIKEKYGEEALNELRHNIKLKKGGKEDERVYETTNGNRVESGLFTLIFDKRSPLYIKDAPNLNLNQIIQIQNTCNFALAHRQHTITIKEIADKFGLDWEQIKKLGPAVYTYGYKFDENAPEKVQFNYCRIKPSYKDDFVDDDEYYVIDLCNCENLYLDLN